MSLPRLLPCGNFYETPDGTFPRVTSVLKTLGKPWLEKWEAALEREMVTEAAIKLYEDLPPQGPKMSNLTFSMTLKQRIGKERAAEKARQTALDVGTRVHKLIEWELRRELGVKVGKAPAVSGEAANAFAQYRAWRDSVHLAPVAVEQTVWHKHDGHAGTLDLLSRVDGELAVVDFKTSKAVYPDYFLQNASYMASVNFMGKTLEPVTRGFTVRLPKRAGDGFEVRETERPADVYEVFRHLLSVWKWAQSTKEVPQC